MEPWLLAHGHQLSRTAYFLPESSYPQPDDLGLLIILGGPMSVYDHRDYPWMAQEFEFIRRCLKAQIPILGICLGAQILAHLLGGTVKPNREKEIGWFPVTWAQPLPVWLAGEKMPKDPVFFHWHGDTFTLPPQAQRLASSQVTPEQGFLWGDRVVALQFHGEIDAAALDQFLVSGSAELSPAPYIQTAEKMKELTSLARQTAPFMELLLTYLESLAHR
ncbi:MAG: C26 family cysteine hydrolase domain-containing family [Spirochaetales bacterium]|nr:C26 family cysteine hydrolase domain-containing family [Spirochaetales bacterium]